jgi:hypothetical protein
MKKLLLTLLCISIVSLSQGQDNANLFELVRFTVKQGQEKSFEVAVKAHNTKFHGPGAHVANLFYNVNGPFAGQYTWSMGPTNYAALDSRPSDGAHDDDWTNNVMSLVESMNGPDYWSRDLNLSTMVDNPAFTKSLIWVYDIKSGKGARFSELVTKVKEVYEKKRPNESFVVAWNEFADTKAGRDVAILFNFEKWAWLDDESNFSKDFEEVHGAGSWHNFLNDFSEVTDGRVDFMRYRVE